MKLLLLSLLVSTSVYAQTEFVGQISGHNTECSLIINQMNAGSADITVIFSDDHKAAKGESLNFTITPSSNILWAGVGANGKDRVQVRLAPGAELTSPSSYAVRWLHGSHFHNIQCLNLQITE
jgi:hypothetical protein